MSTLRHVSGFFLDLLFDSEDGGNILLRNVGFQRNTRRCIPEDKTLRHGALRLTS
jgi:hypothetical protein